MDNDAALLAALRWQIEMGADEAIEAAPIARAAAAVTSPELVSPPTAEDRA